MNGKKPTARWTRLDDGSWGVCGDGFVAGDEVEVRSRQGTVEHVIIARVVPRVGSGPRRAAIVPRTESEAQRHARAAEELAATERRQREFDQYWSSPAGRAERLLRDSDPVAWQAYFSRPGARDSWRTRFQWPFRVPPATTLEH